MMQTSQRGRPLGETPFFLLLFLCLFFLCFPHTHGPNTPMSSRIAEAVLLVVSFSGLSKSRQIVDTLSTLPFPSLPSSLLSMRDAAGRAEQGELSL